ncbi:SDR family NAD(P)-dependent oxidoreductase [Aliiroseovarius crassostreae]|uniref:SDR family NAD(P)-dependent oxidoreductase n=1 Tax=Aliiroseovarius crassostreae TaxID=154981 RepID=UPI003C7D35F9
MTQTALITGTRSGIGLMLARRLLFMGYTVFGMSRATTTELPEDLSANPNYHHYSCDLSDFDALDQTINRLLSEQVSQAAPDARSGGRIDVAFLNAGQFCDALRRTSDTPMDELLSLQRLNCFANKVILDAIFQRGIALPLCAVSSSIAGQRMRAGNGGYALSKATLNALMGLYALEHPQSFFAVIGLCVVDTFLSNKIGTLPLPDDPVFAAQAALRKRAVTDGYAVTAAARADHLISLLLPQPDPRITSGQFIEIRALLTQDAAPVSPPQTVN